jgi:hypothetical protein
VTGLVVRLAGEHRQVTASMVMAMRGYGRRIDRRCGGRRVPAVAFHDSSTPDQQLAGLAGADFRTGRVVDHPALHAGERGTDRFWLVKSVLRRNVS